MRKSVWGWGHRAGKRIRALRQVWLAWLVCMIVSIDGELFLFVFEKTMFFMVLIKTGHDEHVGLRADRIE
ncbi:MAG: hypothetical protein JSR83_24480 [Proteobacteria bacterium]|nr:hypothetical protein [Pseudomonadota bacterium]